MTLRYTCTLFAPNPARAGGGFRQIVLRKITQ